MTHPVSTSPTAPAVPARLAALQGCDAEARPRVERLLHLAARGLTAAYDGRTAEFSQTVRGLSGSAGVRVERQGTNLRYAAMAALGISRLPEQQQRDILAGRTAADVVALAADRAEGHPDPGAVSLVAWATAEVLGAPAESLLGQVHDLLRDDATLPTVDVSWTLTAAVATAPYADTTDLVRRASRLLLRHQGPAGIYPHVLPPTGLPRWRAHVGSFADQVYPLQALARASALTGESDLLAAADRTARQLCDLQGPTGQWWWHYDARDGSVVERYPVYSVHQHAMGPMALFDLLEHGGEDHRAEIAAGLAWLDRHPEVVEELVSERFGLVWRKVGRREPRKAARAIGAATTAVRGGLRVPALDRVLPPVVVDHECRPYELGWLLYAWLPPAGRADTTDPGEPDD